MRKRLVNFLRGMGSVINLAPSPTREIEPLYRPSGTPEDAIREAWRKVGEHLAAAMDQEAMEQERRRR